MRILAFLPNWIGDVAMSTPALRALRRRFPDAILAVAGRSSACELVDDFPWIQGRFVLPARPNLLKMAEVAREMRGARSDLGVVFPHSFRAAMLAWLAGCRQRIGYARGGRSLLLSDAIPPYTVNGNPEPIYMAREYLDLVAHVGCENDRAGLELTAGAQEIESFKRLIGDSRPVVGVAPGAAFGPSKLWPAERYARVADLLAERADARCVLLTGPGEEDTRQAVLKAAKTPLIVCDDGKPTIAMLKAAVSQLDLLICNDSGARHVAVAFHVPVICIIGPTSPRYSEGPYEIGERLSANVDCAPCQEPVCRTDRRCMTRITPERVIESAMRYLPR